MLSQLCILAGYVIFFVSRFSKEKRHILMIENIARGCFIIGYAILNSINSIEHTIYGMVRNFIGKILISKTRSCKILVFIIMILILVVMYGLTFHGFSTVFFILSGIINLFAAFFLKEQGIRLGTVFAAICNVIAFLQIKSYASIICEALCGVVGIISFIKTYRHEVM